MRSTRPSTSAHGVIAGVRVDQYDDKTPCVEYYPNREGAAGSI